MIFSFLEVFAYLLSSCLCVCGRGCLFVDLHSCFIILILECFIFHGFTFQNAVPQKGGEVNLTLGGIDLNNSGRLVFFILFDVGL